MTRRERAEARAAKRREWAEVRRAKADALVAANEPLREDHAFTTQPGHIPERARMIARTERAHEHAAMAQHHDELAAGIERQLERTIYSDDPDAVERLEARIAELEAERAWRKAEGLKASANLAANIRRNRDRLAALRGNSRPEPKAWRELREFEAEQASTNPFLSSEAGAGTEPPVPAGGAVRS